MSDAMTFTEVILLGLLSCVYIIDSNPVRRYCNFNPFCSCPSYSNGCYVCPASCPSDNAWQNQYSLGTSSTASPTFTINSNNFQPGVFPGSGSATANSGTNDPVTTTGSGGITAQAVEGSNELVCPSLPEMCLPAEISYDANNCPICAVNGDHNRPNSLANGCPPLPSNPKNCHMDRFGCILCDGMIATTTRTTPTTTIIKLRPTTPTQIPILTQITTHNPSTAPTIIPTTTQTTSTKTTNLTTTPTPTTPTTTSTTTTPTTTIPSTNLKTNTPTINPTTTPITIPTATTQTATTPTTTTPTTTIQTTTTPTPTTLTTTTPTTTTPTTTTQTTITQTTTTPTHTTPTTTSTTTPTSTPTTTPTTTPSTTSIPTPTPTTPTTTPTTTLKIKPTMSPTTPPTTTLTSTPATTSVTTPTTTPASTKQTTTLTTTTTTTAAAETGCPSFPSDCPNIGSCIDVDENFCPVCLCAAGFTTTVSTGCKPIQCLLECGSPPKYKKDGHGCDVCQCDFSG